MKKTATFFRIAEDKSFDKFVKKMGSLSPERVKNLRKAYYVKIGAIEGDAIINKHIDKLNIEGEKVSSDLQVVKSKIRKDLESGMPIDDVKEKYKSEIEKSKGKIASLVEDAQKNIVEDLKKEKGAKPGIIARMVAWMKMNKKAVAIIAAVSLLKGVLLGSIVQNTVYDNVNYRYQYRNPVSNVSGMNDLYNSYQ
jgi:ElaB/YqjD/DUF883 family membrane-anchored ribosome-binding protein